jgi:hypothetical protein
MRSNPCDGGNDHATNIAESVILIFEARNVKHAAKLAG